MNTIYILALIPAGIIIYFIYGAYCAGQLVREYINHMNNYHYGKDV